MLATLAALVLAQAPSVPEVPPVRLEVLRATSGSGVERLLDGAPATGWSPTGDPLDEGVLFRFEKALAFDRVRVQGCGGDANVALYLDGAGGEEFALSGAKPSEVSPGKEPGVVEARSAFLAFTMVGGKACLAEVTLLLGGRPIRLLPPREVPGRVVASSTLEPAAAYHPSYLFDGRVDFGWVEGAKGAGEGESVTIELERPVELSAIEVWNGYQRSDVHYAANARAKQVAVVRDGGEPEALELRDWMGGQKLALRPGPPATRIELRILSVYPGRKYRDLVLSELRLWDAEGPFTIRTADGAALSKALVKAVAGTPVGAILDRRLAFGCNESSGRLKLRRDHTLVMYQSDCAPGVGYRCLSSVLEGTWVPVGARAGWSEVELFARRHRTDSTLSPYGERPDATQEIDEIAGGRLRIALARHLDAATLEADRARHQGVDGLGCVALDSEAWVLVRGRAITADFSLDGP